MTRTPLRRRGNPHDRQQTIRDAHWRENAQREWTAHSSWAQASQGTPQPCPPPQQFGAPIDLPSGIQQLHAMRSKLAVQNRSLADTSNWIAQPDFRRAGGAAASLPRPSSANQRGGIPGSLSAHALIMTRPATAGPIIRLSRSLSRHSSWQDIAQTVPDPDLFLNAYTMKKFSRRYAPVHHQHPDQSWGL